MTNNIHPLQKRIIFDKTLNEFVFENFNNEQMYTYVNSLDLESINAFKTSIKNHSQFNVVVKEVMSSDLNVMAFKRQIETTRAVMELTLTIDEAVKKVPHEEVGYVFVPFTEKKHMLLSNASTELARNVLIKALHERPRDILDSEFDGSEIKSISGDLSPEKWETIKARNEHIINSILTNTLPLIHKSLKTMRIDLEFLFIPYKKDATFFALFNDNSDDYLDIMIDILQAKGFTVEAPDICDECAQKLSDNDSGAEDNPHDPVH